MIFFVFFFLCLCTSTIIPSFKRPYADQIFEEEGSQELPVQKVKNSERFATLHKTPSPTPIYRSSPVSHTPSPLITQSSMYTISEWNPTPIEKTEEPWESFFIDVECKRKNEDVCAEQMDTVEDHISQKSDDVFLSEGCNSEQFVWYDYPVLRSIEPSKIRALSDLLGNYSAQEVCFLFLKNKEYDIPRFLIEQYPELINARDESNLPLYAFACDNHFRDFLDKHGASHY